MATKSNRSSGTQHNARGATQGTTLVGPQSGLPISEVVDSNGVRRIAVDGNFTAQNVQAQVELDYTEDSVSIGDSNTNATLKINPNGSIDANVEVDAADGDSIAISDGTNTAAVNVNSQLEVHDSVLNDFIDHFYEKLLPLLTNANFLKVANFDNIVPSFSGNIATLNYYEDTALIAKTIVTYNSTTDWNIVLEAYLNDDDGSQLTDDDGSSLFLE